MGNIHSEVHPWSFQLPYVEYLGSEKFHVAVNKTSIAIPHNPYSRSFEYRGRPVVGDSCCCVIFVLCSKLKKLNQVLRGNLRET